MEGIKIAKSNGVKFGRPKIKYPDQFEIVYNDWKCGKIKAVDAIRVLQLKKTIFYKLVSQIEKR